MFFAAMHWPAECGCSGRRHSGRCVETTWTGNAPTPTGARQCSQPPAGHVTQTNMYQTQAHASISRCITGPVPVT